MKYKIKEQHYSLLLTLLMVVLIGIGFQFFLTHYETISSIFSKITDLLFPFIIGFSIAFLLNGPVKFVEVHVFSRLKVKQSFARMLSVISVLVIAIVLVTAFVWIIVPQIVISLQTLIEQTPGYIVGFERFINDLIVRYNIDLEQVNVLLGLREIDFIAQITAFIQEVLPQLITYSITLTSTFFNVVLGIMASAYMLMDKERFVNAIKYTLLILFPRKYGEYTISVGRRANDIFNNFIIGKAIDSLIIGLLCYFGMNLIGLPYALLISVIIGITNMIPVFGPFIGAVPGLIILTIINPIYFVYFGLFVLALQQLDGNVIGPLILGDKLGMPSLFILFAVVIGGGLFGIVGMFIGVPLFALLISICKELLYERKQRLEIKEQD